MREREHARDDEAPERRRPDEPPLRSDVAETMLALRRTAGNQAVSALGARAPAEDKKETKAAGAQATLADLGTIQLLSVSFPSSGREDKEPAVRELVLTSKVGKHSSGLGKAAADGTPMAVEIVIPGATVVRLKLTAAIVSSYRTTGEGQAEAIENWTLDFQSIEHVVEDGEGAKP